MRIIKGYFHTLCGEIGVYGKDIAFSMFFLWYDFCQRFLFY